MSEYEYPEYFYDVKGSYADECLYLPEDDNEFCKVKRIPTHKYVLHHLECGLIPAQVIALLNVPKRIFMTWITVGHKDFQEDLHDAWEVGLVKCEAYHINDLVAGTHNRSFNWQAKKSLLSYAFDDWKKHDKDIKEIDSDKSITDQIIAGISRKK
jgi:hypothetical protein